MSSGSPCSSMSPLTKCVALNNGNKIPVIGLGTFRVTGWNNVYRCIEAGLKAGYRSFDTAAVYNNEVDIGRALKELLPKFELSRENIYLTSKLSPSDLHHEKVEKAVMTSCANLGTSYLDLYLIHWPGAAGVSGQSRVNNSLRNGVWRELAELNKRGTVLSIGVSNYTIGHLEELLDNNHGVDPAVNQVEIHPHYRQPDLVRFCEEHNIVLQAYCSLGGSSQDSLLKDPVVLSVADKLQRSPAQILLRWALQENLIIIPKSLSPERIVSNTHLDFVIPDKDMQVLNNLPTRHKYAWDPTVII